VTESDNLMLQLLRDIRDGQQATNARLGVVEQQLASLRTELAGLRTDNAQLFGAYTGLGYRIDKIVERLDRTAA
jgi:hypothetical protein